MAGNAGSAALIFKIDADTSKFQSEMRGLDASAVKSVGSIGAIASAGPIAATALLAMGAAVVTVVTNLYRLTAASAEYAGAVFDVQEKTGLTAATLSTLKVNAELAGSSLENVGNGAAKFSKLIGEAASGNEKAQQTLAELGVTSYDLETALGQATKTIYDADKGTEQLNLSMKAFGKSGGDLIGTIKQMGGDLSGATKEAERLGLVMTEKDLAAADAFGDSLALLGNQAKVAGVAFTSELMPVLAKYFGMASKWIGENKDLIRTWGTYVASVVANFARGVAVSFRFILDNANALRAGLAVVTLGISELAIQAAKLIAMYYKAKGLRNEGGTAQEGMGGSGVSISSMSPTGGGTGGRGGKGGGSNDAEQRLKTDLQAQIQLQRNQLASLRDSYKDALQSARDRFSVDGDDTAFVLAANAANETYARSVQDVINQLSALEEQLASLDKETTNQSKLRRSKLENEIKEVNEFKAGETKKNNDILLGFDKTLEDKRVELVQTSIAEREKYERAAVESWRQREIDKADAAIESGEDVLENIVKISAFLTQQYNDDYQNRLIQIDAERDRRRDEAKNIIRDQVQLREALAEIDAAADAAKLAAAEELQTKLADIAKKYQVPADQPNPFETTLGWITDLGPDGLLMQTVQKFADGIGSIVQNLVLMGNVGPQAMRKMVASVLAAVAAQAAAQAVMHTAYGIAALTPWGAAIYGPAPFWFKSAALLASIAVGTGLAGRAIAGNAFSGSGSGSSSGIGANDPDNGNRPGLAFTTRFNGFLTAQQERADAVIAKVMDKSNAVIGELTRVVKNLDNKIEGVSPGDVLARGIGGNEARIAQSVERGITDDPSTATNLKAALSF